MLPKVMERLLSLLVGLCGAGCSHRSSLGTRCSFLIESARGAHLGLVSPLARYPCSQLTHVEVGPLMCHSFGVYLLYTLVGNATFPMDVATVL